MGQLMGQQAAAGLCSRAVLSFSKDDRPPQREGTGVDALSEICGLQTAVDAHIAEGPPEPGLEEGPLGGGERIAASLEGGDARFQVRSRIGNLPRRLLALQLLFFFLLLFLLR